MDKSCPSLCEISCTVKVLHDSLDSTDWVRAQAEAIVSGALGCSYNLCDGYNYDSTSIQFDTILDSAYSKGGFG